MMSFFIFISQSQTPKSESKKVTFGLKNNKTAGKKFDIWGVFKSLNIRMYLKSYYKM